jgi:hypothetical protein
MKHFVLRSNCFFKIAVATWVKRKIRRRAGAPAAQRRDRAWERAQHEKFRAVGAAIRSRVVYFLVLSVAPL